MTTRIVRVGNSQGIRIPKAILEQSGLSGEVELDAKRGSITIQRRKRKPREGWEEAFKAMHAAGDDKLLDDVPLTELDEEEWE